MQNLQKEIQRRFQELKTMCQLNFVVDPFSATTDDVAHIGNTAEEELIDLQTNTVAQRFFEKNGHVKFWLKQGTKLAPTLTNVAIIDAILPFATTYLAENAFSVVTQLKTKTRNRLQLHKICVWR